MNKPIHLIIIFFLTTITGWSQPSDNRIEEEIKIHPFKLTVVTWDYSMHLFEGDSKYILTENKLEIVNIPSIGRKEILLISQPLKPSPTLQIFSNMNLDMFDDWYDNPHVVVISGWVIKVEYEKNGTKKKIFIHSCYSKLLATMVSLFNELVPVQYKIDLFH